MGALITIITLDTLPELVVVKGRLRADGIECYVQDEYTIQANPAYSAALGGLKLRVREEDAVQALQLLKEYGYHQGNAISDSDYSRKFKKDLSFLQKWSLQMILTRVLVITIAIIVIIIIAGMLKY